MAKITIEGIGETTARDGKRLVLALMDADIDVLHRCGGNARCTTCRVEVIDGIAGPQTEAETKRLATVKEPTPSMRLSCQLQVRGDLTVRVLNRLQDHPDLDDAGPRPIDWPTDRSLPPE